MTSHLKLCPVCQLRLGQFRQADGLLSRVRSTAARGGRVAASVSVAAALVVSLAANLFLAPAERIDPRGPLSLSAAPSDTLASFYERVASPASPGSEVRR